MIARLITDFTPIGPGAKTAVFALTNPADFAPEPRVYIVTGDAGQKV